MACTKSITTLEQQRWAKHKPTSLEEKQMSEVIKKHQLRTGKTAHGAMSVVDELLGVAADSLGMYGLLIKVYFMVKNRVESMIDVHDKAGKMKEEVEILIEYYEDSMAIRLANNSNAGEYIERQAVELMTSCYAVLDGLGHRSGYRQILRQKAREFMAAPDNVLHIDECINNIRKFRDELMIADRARSRSDVLPLIEGETVGLEDRYRLSEMVSFLSSGSKDGKISVLYLYGDKGVGKSRVLTELVSRVSSYMPEIPKTYILDCSHSGDFRGQGSWPWPVKWQQKLIEQMADAVATEGLSSKEVGKNKIARFATHLKKDKKKVLLAFDNLSEDALLGDVLPQGFSQYLPQGSCVIVSVQGNQQKIGRNSPVYQDILQDVFEDSPECHCVFRHHLVSRLHLYEVRHLFSKFAKPPMDADEKSQQNAVDNLISRCEGLPLLVICFGKYFRKPRPLAVWQNLCEELVAVEDKSSHEWAGVLKDIERRSQDAAQRKKEADEGLVIEKLGLLYKRKFSEELQIVVGDIANVFNGWSQGTVATILGQPMMTNLLLEGALERKKVSARERLPRIAEVTSFYGPGPWTMSLLFVLPDLLGSARQIYREQHLQATAAPIPESLCQLSTTDGARRSYRSVCLIDCTGDFEMQWFEKLQGLRYVVLHNLNLVGTNFMPLGDLQYLHLGDDNPYSRLQSFPFRSQHLMNLKTLVLQGFDFEGSSFEMPPQLVNLSLIGCSNPGVPSIMGSKTLQNLHIRACKGLLKIPARESNNSIENISLQLCTDLHLEHLPRFLTKLQALKKVEILTCSAKSLEGRDLAIVAQGLGTLQVTPTNSEALKHLIMNDCHEMISLPIDVFSYKNIVELDLEFCSKIHRLPPQIQVFRNMEHLNLAWCIGLEVLPPEIGSLRALRTLSIVACSKLQTLPKEIGRLQMLTKLQMDHCAGLKSLPGEILNLQSLIHLSMSWCTGLRDNNMLFSLSKLPKHLKYLNVAGLNPKLLEHLVADLMKAKRMPDKLVKDISSQYRRFWLDFLSEQAKETEKSAKMLERLFNSDYGPSTKSSFT